MVGERNYVQTKTPEEIKKGNKPIKKVDSKGNVSDARDTIQKKLNSN